MLKICIWLNIPSHYQRAFFTAIEAHDNVELAVRYFAGASKGRAEEGWSDSQELRPFEQCVENLETVSEMANSVPDWQSWIHLTASSYNNDFVDFLCENNAKWCRWSETPGYTFASKLGFNVPLYKALRPLSLFLKRSEGKRITKHALYAFGQGQLALQAFNKMGIPNNKIKPLYYSPAPLKPLPPDENIKSFAGNKRVFLSVGALSNRKGIDVLMKAFASLNTKDWCLVLCGLDKNNGYYQQLAKTLGIKEDVLFTGAVPSSQIASAYAAADVFVLASRFDGWGAVLNEAASIGMPLISTDMCGAAWHLIKENQNGRKVKAGSIPDLQDAMRAYIDSPTLCVEHGNASKNLYLNEFTPAKNAERLVNTLNRI